MRKRKSSTFIVYTHCSRCWEKLPEGSVEDLCADCRANWKPAPQYQPYGASGVAGTYLSSLDRLCFAEKIREARRERA